MFEWVKCSINYKISIVLLLNFMYGQMKIHSLYFSSKTNRQLLKTNKTYGICTSVQCIKREQEVPHTFGRLISNPRISPANGHLPVARYCYKFKQNLWIGHDGDEAQMLRCLMHFKCFISMFYSKLQLMKENKRAIDNGVCAQRSREQ